MLVFLCVCFVSGFLVVVLFFPELTVYYIKNTEEVMKYFLDMVDMC